jgi:histidyl-tRNA synthetase
MGDVMATILLEKYGRIPEIKPFSSTVLVTIFDENLLQYSTAFAAGLQKRVLRRYFFPDAVKLQKQFKFADRLGVAAVAVIGRTRRRLVMSPSRI